MGIVLGLVLLIALIILSIFLCKDKLFSEKCRSKFFHNPNNDNNNNNNLNNSYEPIIRRSQLSSQNSYPLNGVKHRRTSMTTSTGGIDDQENGILQSVYIILDLFLLLNHLFYLG